jgi:hypothetical protein
MLILFGAAAAALVARQRYGTRGAIVAIERAAG